MAFRSANHFAVSGAGIDGVIDITSAPADGLVSIAVDGRELRAPSLDATRQGIVIRAIHEEAPDDHTLVVTLTIPAVNLGSGTETGAGYAILTRARNAAGGPSALSGPLHLYEMRPLTVTASLAES